MEFIDVQAGFGGFVPGKRDLFTADMLASELDRSGIAKAMVRIVPEDADFDIGHSNELLYAACEKHKNFIPCPIAAPDMPGDLGGAEHQVCDAIAHGAWAMVLRPVPDHWLPEAWVCDDIMNALAAHNMPAFTTAGLIDYAKIAYLAGAFPNNTFIYAGIDYRALRTELPLMSKFKNIYISTGVNFNFHEGFTIFDKTVGVDRLLFGTALPYSEPGASIGCLTYSGLESSKIAAIAKGNFEKLAGRIK